jgi:uncharacterized protein YbaP (TraB family)
MSTYRYLLVLVLIVLLGFLFPVWALERNTVQYASTSAHEVNNVITGNKGLLWRVERADIRPSYLYGTMHVSDPRVTRLAPVALRAFDQANPVVLEITMDHTTMAAVMRGMFFSNGQTLKSVVGEVLYARVLEAVSSRGMPEAMIVNMKPWAVMALLLPEGEGEGEALDAILYARALKQGKRVVGLETVAEQLAIFDAMSLPVQVQMVESAVATQAEMEAMFAEMMKIYLDGDLQGLQEFSDSVTAEDYPLLQQAFNKLAINDRNLRMVGRLQSHLDAGNAFVAVGALHLPGEKGILNLLVQQGFDVSPVQ